MFTNRNFMEEIFAEFSLAIYDLTRKNEENTVFFLFSHGKNHIQKLDAIKTKQNE